MGASIECRGRHDSENLIDDVIDLFFRDAYLSVDDKMGKTMNKAPGA